MAILKAKGKEKRLLYPHLLIALKIKRRKHL